MKPERRLVTTRVRFATLASVFRTDRDQELHPHIARLCVLFEDLRTEIVGLSSDDLGRLNEMGTNARVLYFLRRSLGTLHEFADALQSTDSIDGFCIIRRELDRPAREQWQRAIEFFKKHESTIARARHHVGGHFGLQAARHAIENFAPSASGSIEIKLFSDRRGGAKLGFASEIAATALVRNVAGSDVQRRVRRLIRIAVVGYRYAVRAVDCITGYYLWDRFGR